MISEQATVYIQSLEARIKVLEDFIQQKHPDFPALSNGASGTMMPVEERPIIGYVTPKGDFANIRKYPTVASDSNPVISEIRETFPTYRRVQGEYGYWWYEIPLGGFIRNDVVTFSKEEPSPSSLIPIKAALWPAPVTGYTITTRHGEHGHDGVDLACADGTVVRCGPNGGYVSVAKRCDDCDPQGTPGVRNAVNNYGFGTYVVIRYAFDLLPPPLQALLPLGAFLFTMHAHLSMIATVLTPGMTLDPYQKIGEVGSTGDSTGSHLHFAAHWSLDPHADFYSIRNNAIDPSLLVKA
jgi:hypothetical protein